MKMPLVAVQGAKAKIIASGLSTEEEIDDLLADLERLISDPETVHISLITVQVWGRKE